MVRFQQTLTLAVIAVAVAAQRASELTWPHASHADDIEDILGPGPAHLPPILNDLQPHGGPAGIAAAVQICIIPFCGQPD
jgi:hypothetical protein